jgi:hypothetical protein
MSTTTSNPESAGEQASAGVATPAGRPLHRQRAFGLLWIGQGVSQLGTQAACSRSPPQSGQRPPRAISARSRPRSSGGFFAAAPPGPVVGQGQVVG